MPTRDALQLAKVSRLLLAMERGSMESFAGQSIDDIVLEPEGNCLALSIIQYFVEYISFHMK
jgi:hypothetical protein